MINIFDWFGYSIPYKTLYKQIKEAGFDGVLLYWGNEFGNTNYKSNPELVRKEGLFIENIHTSYENINDLWLDNLNGEGIVAYLLQCVEDCCAYEIPTMVVHLSSGENPPTANQLGTDRIQKIVDSAEKRSINIALENLRKPEYLQYIFDRISSNRLGFCYDSGHQNWRSKNIDLLSMYGNKLMALHLHDNDGNSDQHLLPFDGNINWNNIMQKLNRTGSNIPTTLEITNTGYEYLNASEFLAIAYERAKKLAGLR